MSNTYRIHGTRYLRKYTAAERSSIYAYMSDVRKIANTLCTVPWERVGRDIAATTTIHTEEGLDWNDPERERFDAAEWCGEHSDGFHRAFAQAACYVFALPDSAVGTSIEKLGIQVTSDPYNPYGARISAMTSATLDIPMDCATVREGEVFHAPDEDGLGAAPRLFMRNDDGTQTWYANTERVELEPETPLTAKKYLFVFCCLENYNRGRDGWIEGSSYIDNDVELTLSTACEDLNDGELNELSVPAQVREFNVCCGGNLPPLVGEASGVQTIDVTLDGQVFSPSDSPSTDPVGPSVLDDTAAIGLRTAYGLLYKGETNHLAPAEYALSSGSRRGAAFAVSVLASDGVANPVVNGNWKRGYCYYEFNFLAAADGVLFAHTTDGILMRSTDGGVTWTPTGFHTTDKWNSLAYGDGVFVAGSSNSGIWRSTDGETWTQTGQTTGAWNSIAYGDGVFVAGSDDNGIWRSTDGETWTQTGQTTGAWNSIAYGDGVFVAVTSNNGIWRSTDGETWTQTGQTTGKWYSIAYGDGVFVAGSDDNGTWRSTDGGATWSYAGLVPNRVENVWFVAYGDGVFFVGITLSGQTLVHVLRSTDGGTTWADVPSVEMRRSSQGISFTYGGGAFVLASVGRLKRSTNGGVTWTPTGLNTTDEWNSVAYGDGVFVACSSNSGIWRSTDVCAKWTQTGQTTGKWNSVAYGNGVFVAGSSNSGLWRSTDGETWTQTGQTTGAWNSIAYGDGVFVASSNVYSSLWRSTDSGVTWTQTGQTTGAWTSVAYGNGVFVACSSNSCLWRSTDSGVTWTLSGQTTGIGGSIAYGDGVFVISSGAIGLLRSTDGGVTWSQSGQTTVGYGFVSFGDGVFFLYSVVNGGLWRSTDGGVTWSQIQTKGYWKSIAFGDGVFVSTGNDDGLVYSKNIERKMLWRIASSVLFVRTSVPLDFVATKIRLDWNEWTRAATSGSKFNVWLRRGAFSEGYDGDVVKNHLIYDAKSDSVGDYELVGVIDATDQSTTATFDLKKPLTGEVATFLLTAFVSMDRVNPSDSMSLPVGPTPELYVDHVSKEVVNGETSWKPDITLLG